MNVSDGNKRGKERGKGFPVRLIAAAVVAGFIGMGWQMAGAQQEPGEPGERQTQQAPRAQGQAQQGQQGQGLKVGTYEPQEVFRTYHRTAAFQQEMQQMQQQAASDPQAALQMQQQAQQRQQQLIQQFQQDVDRAMPEVAREAGVQVIAAQVVYQDPSVQVEDLTAAVSAKINEGQAAQGEEGGAGQQSPLQRLQRQQQQEGQLQRPQGQERQPQEQPQR